MNPKTGFQKRVDGIGAGEMPAGSKFLPAGISDAGADGLQALPTWAQMSCRLFGHVRPRPSKKPAGHQRPRPKCLLAKYLYCLQKESIIEI